MRESCAKHKLSGSILFSVGLAGLAPPICRPCGRSASSGTGLSEEMEKRKSDLHFKKANGTHTRYTLQCLEDVAQGDERF